MRKVSRRLQAWLFVGSLVALALPPGVGAANKNVLEAIKNLQKSKKAEDRASAAETLGGKEDPEAIAALAQALSDRDATVRQAAASALWETGDKAKAAEPALRQVLEDPEPKVVAWAAGALEAMDVKPATLAEARRRALRAATDDHTAFLAARGLIGIDPPSSVVPALVRYLSAETEAMARGNRTDHTGSVEMAEKALARLAKTKDRTAIPRLIDSVGRTPSADPWLLKTLGLYSPPPDRFAEILVKGMRARLPGTREVSLSQCRDLDSDKDVALWAPEAIALTRDPEESVRSEAIRSLQKAGGRAAASAPDLVRLMKGDTSARVRASAAEALGDVADASAAVSQKTKAEAADQAKAALVTAIADRDPNVADKALTSYNRLSLPTAEAVATLTQVAEGNGPPALRQRALGMLRNRQGQAKPVLERIRALTKSPDVAEEARTAVEWIERGGPGSPNPLMTTTAATTKSSSGPASPAKPGAARRDPGAEERGLAKLRELEISFEADMFYKSLSDVEPEAVKAFLDAGMSASHAFASTRKRSPLMVLFFGNEACERGQPITEDGLTILKALLAGGADVNQVDQDGNTALMFAADKCDRVTMRLLISAGAKVDARDPVNKISVLEGSIGSGNPGVEELIAAGARLDAETAKRYLESYKKNPKAIELIRKAMPR